MLLHVIITWLFYTNPLVNFNNSFWNKKVTLRVKGVGLRVGSGGRVVGGMWKILFSLIIY